jgi:predicted house-cleaning noncanonical NTP pyrophosphatase (MazG superfamily)
MKGINKIIRQYISKLILNSNNHGKYTSKHDAKNWR